MHIARTQASAVTFELHTLGWKAFQDLCLSLLSDILGQTVQGFFDSRDGGRDGAFYGVWKASASETLAGSFTVQCKFTAKSDGHLRCASLSDEFKKATLLAQRGLADNYLLLTNAHVSGSVDADTRKRFSAIPLRQKIEQAYYARATLGVTMKSIYEEAMAEDFGCEGGVEGETGHKFLYHPNDEPFPTLGQFRYRG